MRQMKRILALGGGGFLMENRHSPIDQFIVQPHRQGATPDLFRARPRAATCRNTSTSSMRPMARWTASRVHLAFFRNPYRAPSLWQILPIPCSAWMPFSSAAAIPDPHLRVWREWGLQDIFHRALATGVLLCGMSAGAICWFDSGLTDSSLGRRLSAPAVPGVSGRRLQRALPLRAGATGRAARRGPGAHLSGCHRHR